jgi:pimeloyl-ACP methyl ester carboxylesterase
MRVFLPRLVPIIACAALAACSSPGPARPDLARLYRVGTGPGDTTPVIVIPGLFGSKLRDRVTGDEVWPGSSRDVLWSDYRGLALEFDPQTLAVRRDDFEAYDLADEVLGHDIYRPIIDTLERFGGYARGTPGTRAAPGERRFYVFPYDWRQDNVTHARELEQLIDAIRADYGDPTLRVDIVAHSMGGLIARYYLRYGTVDVLEGGGDELVTLYGTARVRKLILLGTPNMGAASSLHAFIGGEPIGFRRIAPEVLATMPSGYQLFPHPLVTWLIDTAGRGLNLDLFDGATWRKFGWSVFDPAVLTRIRSMHQRDSEIYVAALQRYFDLRLDAVGARAGDADPLRTFRRRLHAHAGAPCARRRKRAAGGAALSRRHPKSRSRCALQRTDAGTGRWPGHQALPARARNAGPDGAPERGQLSPGRVLVLSLRAPRPADQQPQFSGQPAERAPDP